MPEQGGGSSPSSPLPAPPAPRGCDLCGLAAAKYRCPACDRRTCSAACVEEHKKRFKCTGKRPRAEFVAPLRAFSDQLLLRDYGLLEEVDAAADRADRELRITGEELGIHHPGRHRARVALARACSDPSRRTILILAPAGMALARKNTSRLMGGPPAAWRKGKDKGWGKGKWKSKDKGKGKGKAKGSEKPAWIAWRVEWRFEKSNQVLIDNALPEHEVLGPALERFFKNSCPWGATRHLLLPYAEAGLGSLEVFLHQAPRASAAAAGNPEAGGTGPANGRDSDEESADGPTLGAPAAAAGEGFVRLDKGKSLRENLEGRAIVEFPVLHVALPQEFREYALRCLEKGLPAEAEAEAEASLAQAEDAEWEEAEAAGAEEAEEADEADEAEVTMSEEEAEMGQGPVARRRRDIGTMLEEAAGDPYEDYEDYEV